MATEAQILLVMIIYISLLVVWGIYQGRKVKSGTDYAIAGRNLPGWVAALSERATGESSWALLGLPGAAYATGILEIWTALGCVAGIITTWIVIAWRLRNEAEKYSVETFTDFIAKKHGESAKWIRIIGSFTIVFFFFFYVGAQFLGGGKTLNTMFHIHNDPQTGMWIGMLITAAIIIPYTIYGGFTSVVWTDVIQAIVMIATLIIGPIVGVIYLSNHPELFAQDIPGALARAGEEYNSLTGATGGFVAGIAIAGGFSWFFGYLGGQPQLSMRFMAIRDHQQVKKARIIGVAWTLLAYIGALALGWIGIAIFGPHGLTDPELVMPSVLLTIFPPAIAALLITGAIAAMISTADSLLVLSATEFNENLLPAIAEEQKRKKLRRSRIVTAILAIIALALAYVFPSNLIFTIVSYVWAGIGGTFSVVILLTLFWKRYHGKAVIITIITGLLFTIVWFNTGMEEHYLLDNETVAVIALEIGEEQIAKLNEIKDQRIVSQSKFREMVASFVGNKTREQQEYVAFIVNSAKKKGITARILTFFIALFVGIASSFVFKRKVTAD
ncbi:MAG: sodium/proline symporter [Bacteroidales bacterium]|nr:sodium/proline symporter [Bacteroidales bacterium]